MNKHLLLLTGIFIASRILFRLIFNVEFDDFLFEEGWQFLDKSWLKNDLFGSIYYLHSQPPFGNLVIGILLLFFKDISAPLHFLFMSFSLIAVLSFYLSCITLGIRKKYSIVIGIFLIFHPQLILYENYFFYSVPVMSLITVSVYFIIKYFSLKKVKYILLFFTSLLLLSLTRSMFHLVFILGILILLFLISEHKKQSVFIGLAMLILCSSWYFKNKMEFGFFGASSWMGMNISRIMLEKEMQDTYLSEGPFMPLGNYEKKGYQLKNNYPQIPQLYSKTKKDSIVNFNNENYIYLAKEFKEASIQQLRKKPSFYLTNVLKGTLFYFKPTIHYSHLQTNYNKIQTFSSFYIFDLPNLIELAGVKLSRDAFIILSVIPGMTFHLIIYFLLFRYFKEIKWKKLTNQNKQIIFLTIFILFVMVVGNLLELFENNRFRFTTTTIFYLLSIFLFDHFFIRKKSNLRFMNKVMGKVSN